MKKRPFTTLLLIWLFSQQLFAAVWAMPHGSVDCVGYSQNECFSDVAHMGHHMSTDSDSQSSNDASMICDHCCTACQASLISNDYSLTLKAVHLTVEGESISASIHTFPSTLYRPPILA